MKTGRVLENDTVSERPTERPENDVCEGTTPAAAAPALGVEEGEEGEEGRV